MKLTGVKLLLKPFVKLHQFSVHFGNLQNMVFYVSRASDSDTIMGARADR